MTYLYSSYPGDRYDRPDTDDNSPDPYGDNYPFSEEGGQEHNLLQDLHDLVEDEIEFTSFVGDEDDPGFGNLCLSHRWAEIEINVASLEDETFFIVNSGSDDCFPGCTIGVFELIDLLLEGGNWGSGK